MTRPEARMIAEELHKLFRKDIETVIKTTVSEETDTYISAKEAAAMLGWEIQTLYNRIKDIPHVKVGKKLRFSVKSMHQYIQRK